MNPGLNLKKYIYNMIKYYYINNGFILFLYICIFVNFITIFDFFFFCSDVNNFHFVFHTESNLKCKLTVCNITNYYFLF